MDARPADVRVMPYLEKSCQCQLPWVQFGLPEWVITAEASVQPQLHPQVTVLHIVIAKEQDTVGLLRRGKVAFLCAHRSPSKRWKLTGLCDFLGKGNLLNVKYQQLYFGATFRKIKGLKVGTEVFSYRNG